MADTKWILTDWTIAQWTDATQTVNIFFLWEALKAAADERQAFIEQVFNTSFDADNEFPGFGPTGLTVSGSGTTNNIDRIVNALNNTSGTKFDFVKTDTIAADGTTVAAGNLADYLDLGDILTDVLSYASDELLIALDTKDIGPGEETAIWQMAWLKQLYQVMNYPQYYARQIINTTDSFLSVIETQTTQLVVLYTVDNFTGLMTKGEANYTNAPNSPTDLYVTNDLNETSPFSSTQDVYDYTEATFDGQIATADWATSSDQVNADINARASLGITFSGPLSTTSYTSTIFRRRVRFKVTDNKRAVSPNTYVAVLKYYFFLIEANSVSTFNDWGTGINERETEFLTLVADGSDYYYLETATQPDYTSFTVPSFPAEGASTFNSEGFGQYSLNEFTNITTPILGLRRTDIMVEANNSDGTALEYYTP